MRKGRLPITIAFAAALAIALSIQVLCRPTIGIADNSDFSRIMLDFGLQHRSEVYHERYFDFFNRLYLYHPESAAPSGYLTSSKALAWVAVQLHRQFTPGELFDLRWLGFLNALFYWGGGLLLFIGIARHCEWFWPAHQRGWRSFIPQLVISSFALLILVDVAQVQFINSFYAEPTAIIALVWLTACSILLSQAGDAHLPGLGKGPGASTALLAAYVIAAIFFVTAKPQFAPLGLILGLWALRLFTRSLSPAVAGQRRRQTGRVWGVLSFLAIGAASLFTYSVGTPQILKEMTSYNLIFIELLTESPDPLGDLAALGFSDPAQLAGFAGLYHWDHRVQAALQAQPELRAEIDKIDHFALLQFYLTHPPRLVRLLVSATRSAFDTHIERYGNFEQEAGFPPYAQSGRFTLWSRLHQELIPQSSVYFILFFLASLAAFAYARLRLYRSGPTALFPETQLVLLILALAGFLVVVFGEGQVDANRHLIVFNLTCDLSILFTIDYGFAGLRGSYG